MKHLLILLMTGLAFLQIGKAQTYDTALGVRLGTELGLTVQQRIANKTTLEAVIAHRRSKDLLSAALLAERHFPILFKRFNVYGGAGVHKGWYTSQPADSTEKLTNPFGLTFVAGAEISLGRLNISYDWMPSYNIVGEEKAFASGSSISVRYIINKRETKFQKWRNKRKKNREKKKKNKDSGGFFGIFKKS